MTAGLSVDPIHSGICSDPVLLRRERQSISTMLCYGSYIKNPKQWKKCRRDQKFCINEQDDTVSPRSQSK